jgi:1-acyl-sn-glycerol-3-phosphate acyltransferase
VSSDYFRPAPDAGLVARVACRLLALRGWRIVLLEPLPPQCVIVFYPHTSNWDFPIGLLVKWALDLRIRWVAKDSLFRWPQGAIFRRWGGIPVNRRERTGFTERLAQEFARRNTFHLLIAPEGTRDRTPGWKSGFYHIAGAARVPICLAFIDYPRREIGFGGSVRPTGDAAADVARIADFYADKTGRRPERQGPVQIAVSETSER